jgi:surface protein
MKVLRFTSWFVPKSLTVWVLATLLLTACSASGGGAEVQDRDAGPAAPQLDAQSSGVELSNPNTAQVTYPPQDGEVTLTVSLVDSNGDPFVAKADQITFSLQPDVGSVGDVTASSQAGTFTAVWTPPSVADWPDAGAPDLTVTAAVDGELLASTAGWVVEGKPFYLASNGVTVKCEWADVGETGVLGGVTYTKRARDDVNTTDGLTSLLNGAKGGDSNAITAIEHTCTTGVEDFSSLFPGADDSDFEFDGDIRRWDTGSAKDMSSMFVNNTVFDQNLSAWNVSSVTNMKFMFEGASAFNSDLSGWDVSSVTNMENMFGSTDSFKSDISAWNTGAATDMSSMFNGATAFNSDLKRWDVSSVTNMDNMFNGATSFNSDLSSWNVAAVKSCSGFNDGATNLTKLPNFSSPCSQ